MSAFLLDVNVLIALLWPAHSAHLRVQRWFAHNGSSSWATCPITQMGFVRIVSNPTFSPHAVTPEEAMQVLAASTKHPKHHFWVDNVSIVQAAEKVNARVLGHKQISDLYLLGLALHHRGRLATLDQSLITLLPVHTRDLVEVL